MGIDVGSEDDLVWHMLHSQTSALNDMQEQYKHIEEIGIARGMVLDSQQDDPPILMKDLGASDPEVSSSSDQETSGDSEVYHTSDPEISIQSDSSGHSEQYIISLASRLAAWTNCKLIQRSDGPGMYYHLAVLQIYVLLRWNVTFLYWLSIID